MEFERAQKPFPHKRVILAIMPRKDLKGSFWPQVRQRMYEKAVELYMYDHPEAQNKPELEELHEAGYMHTAKVLVLREMRLENHPDARK